MGVARCQPRALEERNAIKERLRRVQLARLDAGRETPFHRLISPE
jgi:hypothetical protein